MKAMFDTLKRGQARRPLKDMSVHYDSTSADLWAGSERARGHSARVYHRAVRAGGATLEVFVVVVRAK